MMYFLELIYDPYTLALLLSCVAFCIVCSISFVRGRHETDSDIARVPYRFSQWAAPLANMAFALVFMVFLPRLDLGESATAYGRQIAMLWIIAGAAWLLIRGVHTLQIVLLFRYDIEQKDNLMARRVHTQMRVIGRVFSFVIIVLAGGCMLMTWDRASEVGMSILASAGVVGITVGFAAQKTITAVLAGIQIAFTQPIRIDDVVIVEGEWGRIEEITLTYVVVQIWDDRRLIVPINYFIEKPFQNWTRRRSQLLGTVFLYTDYRVDVDALREELHRILQACEYWDQRAWCLQVTDAKRDALELRALMSAAGSSDAWEMRCIVREKLLAFLQREYPDSLPRTRVALTKEGESTPAPAKE